MTTFDLLALSIDTTETRDELEFEWSDLTERQRAERAPRKEPVRMNGRSTLALKATSPAGTSTYALEIDVDAADTAALGLILEPAIKAGALEASFTNPARASRPRPPRPRASGLDTKGTR